MGKAKDAEKTLAGIKEKVAKEIAAVIEAEGLTQREASIKMNDASSQVSLVVNGHLRGFSLERLLSMLASLGRTVTITTAKARTGKVVFARIPS